MGRSAKNVHPPWQNPRYAHGWDDAIKVSEAGHTSGWDGAITDPEAHRQYLRFGNAITDIEAGHT